MNFKYGRVLLVDGLAQGLAYNYDIKSFILQSNEEDNYFILSDMLTIETLNNGAYERLRIKGKFPNDTKISKILLDPQARYYRYEKRGDSFLVYFRFDMRLWRAVFDSFVRVTEGELVERLL